MLGILGSPTIDVEGRAVPLVLQPKALALLAYLALAGRAVERREIAELLFPAAENPRATLRWYLAYLRTALPALDSGLQATRDTVALTIPTDAAQFRQGAVHVVQHPDAQDASAILALYRGDLLTGLSVSVAADFDNWLYIEQEGLRRLLRKATVAFARRALAGDGATEAIGPLARLVSVDPYYEDGHILLLDAYTALGQHSQAATTYDRYQRTMRQDLRSEPRTDIARRFEPGDKLVDRPPMPRDELVPLSEITIHLVEWPGSGPAILGIHGSGLSAYSLTALAERLGQDFRFCAIDLRGHGFSDMPPAGYDLEHHVQDVLELIAVCGLQRPVLLGHSAGGAVAAFVAGKCNASGLILLEGMIGDRAFTENAAARGAPIADLLDRRFAGFDAYRAEQVSRSSRTPWSDEAEHVANRWIHFELAQLPDGTYRRRALRQAVEAEWASIVEADSLGALRRLYCPVLVVQALGPWRDGRPYFTDAIVNAQLRAASLAEHFVARNSDHGTLIRDPEPAMIAAIREFVARCAPPIGTPIEPGVRSFESV